MIGQRAGDRAVSEEPGSRRSRASRGSACHRRRLPGVGPLLPRQFVRCFTQRLHCGSGTYPAARHAWWAEALRSRTMASARRPPSAVNSSSAAARRALPHPGAAGPGGPRGGRDGTASRRTRDDGADQRPVPLGQDQRLGVPFHQAGDPVPVVADAGALGGRLPEGEDLVQVGRGRGPYRQRKIVHAGHPTIRRAAASIAFRRAVAHSPPGSPARGEEAPPPAPAASAPVLRERLAGHAQDTGRRGRLRPDSGMRSLRYVPSSKPAASIAASGSRAV